MVLLHCENHILNDWTGYDRIWWPDLFGRLPSEFHCHCCRKIVTNAVVTPDRQFDGSEGDTDGSRDDDQMLTDFSGSRLKQVLIDSRNEFLNPKCFCGLLGNLK